MFEWLNSWHWLRPLWLLLPLAVLLASRWGATDSLALQLPAHLATALRGRRATDWRSRLESLNRWLLVVLLITALAGPAWRLDREDQSLAATELTVVIDLSSAALVDDVAPSRLERTGYLLKGLWRRAGLVSSELWVVAGSAHRALPMNRDSAVSALYLQQLSPDLMPSGGRNLAELERHWVKPPDTIAVFTGVLTGSDRVLLERWSASGSRVHLLWLNAQPLLDTPSGVSVYSSSNVNKSVAQWHSALMAEQWQKQPLEQRDYRDMSPYIIMAVLFLAVLRLLIVALRRAANRHQLPLALLLATLLQGGSPQPAHATEMRQPLWRDSALALLLTPDQLGRWHYQRGDYARAASQFIDLHWSGAAYYADGQFTMARQQFVALNSREGWFNAALSAAAERRYDLALNAVNRALQFEPEWSVAQLLRAELIALLEAMAEQSDRQQVEQWQSDSIELQIDERELNANSSGELAQWQNTQQMSAEQLAETALREAWLQQVSRGPAEFLQRKFRRQQQREEVRSGE